ncbi:MAG TPA: RNA polymerase sigma factor [bacterium]|nr:RNA polymerase sigma factor [bacterium]
MVRLFQAALAGDRRATEEIHGLIRRFARHLCHRRDTPGFDWEDVAQDASRRAFDGGLERYRGSGSEQSYLYTIVKTTALQMARSSARRAAREDAAEWPAESRSPDDTAHFEVGTILSKLAEDCRGLLVRVFLLGATYTELAREWNLAESSVRSRLSRCLRKARLLAEEGS